MHVPTTEGFSTLVLTRAAEMTVKLEIDADLDLVLIKEQLTTDVLEILATTFLSLIIVQVTADMETTDAERALILLTEQLTTVVLLILDTGRNTIPPEETSAETIVTLWIE